MPAEELAKAKNYVALRFPRAFEATRGIAGQLTHMIIYGMVGHQDSAVDRDTGKSAGKSLDLL